MSNFTVDSQTLSQNRTTLRQFVADNGLDAMYVSNFDAFISEYVPAQERHQYYFSGFTGSMAEMLATKDEIRLYVDGRYYEQADLEVDLNEVTVVKVPHGKSLKQNLLEDIQSLNVKTLGFEAERASLAYKNEFEKIATLKGFNDELNQKVGFTKYTTTKEVTPVDLKEVGLSTKEKIDALHLSDEEAVYISAIDQVAWISNCRGYQLPFLASFLSRALVTDKKVYLLMEDNVPVNSAVEAQSELEIIRTSSTQLEETLTQLRDQNGIKNIQYSTWMNALDYSILENVFTSLELKDQGLIPFCSIKNKSEIKSFENAFLKSSKAVYNTLKWVKESKASGADITELDFFKKTEECYRAEGAVELSFNSIAAVGANGSIIHFGASSDKTKIPEGELCLLDSGGYYEGGFATDKTRAFWSNTTGTPSQKHKEIYTLVLKGLINAESAVFPEDTKGCVIDGLARAAMHKLGYNYAHGTGHGVGVHVHEGGVRISPQSTLPMKEGQVVSIEPGIYLPGFGGVRLENVCVVEKHPEFEGYLKFRPFSYIGFDPLLIDESLLNHEEKDYLEKYEARCAEVGTSFR